MQAIAPFLTGLGLFFCGVHFVAANLVPLAGRRFRALLMRMGKRPWMAAAFGTAAGVITQSANAVTAIIIGLVSGGLIDKRRSILIPTWSHVGTSVLVILVAIDLRLAASYLILLTGCAVYFGFDRNDRVRFAVGTLLGLGLLFLGMQLIKSGAVPLRDVLVNGGFIASIAKARGLLLLVGIGLSLVCQSSSVAGALAVAASSAGLVDLSGACWLIYGANLGSGLNFVLLAKTHRGEAAQIALMQAVQKFSGFLVVIAASIVDGLTGRFLIENGVAMLNHSISAQVAWVFLLYQLAGSLICTVFAGPIIALLERVAPPSKLQELSKPAYLIEDALVEPSFAIELVGREEQRLLERLPAMLDTVRADVEGEPVLPATLRTAAAVITRAMAGYLESISEGRLDRSDRERVVRLQHRAANLNAMHEGLDEFVTACVAARQWPSSGRVADQMIESLHALLSALVEAAAANDKDEQELLLGLLGHRDELMERIRRRVLREDPSMPAKAQEAMFSATMLFERVVWLARRCAILLNPDPAAGSSERVPLPAEPTA
jgi:phosphate:Na+ symporter